MWSILSRFLRKYIVRGICLSWQETLPWLWSYFPESRSCSSVVTIVWLCVLLWMTNCPTQTRKNQAVPPPWSLMPPNSSDKVHWHCTESPWKTANLQNPQAKLSSVTFIPTGGHLKVCGHAEEVAQCGQHSFQAKTLPRRYGVRYSHVWHIAIMVSSEVSLVKEGRKSPLLLVSLSFSYPQIPFAWAL